MPNFEYKVVPAPTRGLKAKGVKGTQARFANALQTVMNDLGADGWEYQRTDTLPVEERQGLTGKTTNFQNMLVFRRMLEDEVVETPAVAALIEDQSNEVVEAPIEEETAAAPVELDEQPATDNEPDEIVAEEPAVAAEERVNETLSSTFAFPWAKRQANPRSRPEDDTQHPAE